MVFSFLGVIVVKEATVDVEAQKVGHNESGSLRFELMNPHIYLTQLFQQYVCDEVAAWEVFTSQGTCRDIGRRNHATVQSRLVADFWSQSRYGALRVCVGVFLTCLQRLPTGLTRLRVDMSCHRLICVPYRLQVAPRPNH